LRSQRNVRRSSRAPDIRSLIKFFATAGLDNIILTAASGYQSNEVAPFLRSAQLAGVRAGIVLLRATRDSDFDRAARKLFPNVTVWSPLSLRCSHHVRRFGRFARAASYLPAQLLRGLENAASAASALECFQHPAISRYSCALRMLSSLPAGIARVLLADCRDVVFQADPFERFENGLYTGEEELLIKDEPNNAKWLYRLFDDFEDLAALKDARILCSGVTCGDRVAIENYLRQVIAILHRKAHRILTDGAFDQGVHNCVFRLRSPRKVSIQAQGSPLICTVANNWRDNYLLDPVRGLLTHSGETVAIVHQYDRKRALHSHFERRLGVRCPLNPYAS